MLCYGELASGLLSFLFAAASFWVSHGVLDFQAPLASVRLGIGAQNWHVSRYSLELAPSSEPLEGSYLVLAADSTRRKDPLNGFRTYTGGWNINERHYWASVGFTAASLFIVAAIWFLFFGVCLSIIFVRHFYLKRRFAGYSQTSCLSTTFFIIFVIGVIIGCFVIYSGEGRFHDNTAATLDDLITQADKTSERLGGISQYLNVAKNAAVYKILIPTNVQSDINRIETRIESSSSKLSEAAKLNSNNIKKPLDSLRNTLLMAVVVMLILVVAGFAATHLGKQPLVFCLVVAGWIIVTGTLILTGVSLFLHNAAEDTCVAIGEWVTSPRPNTALDEILPCVDKSIAEASLSESKEVIAQLVEVVNEVITNVTNINFAPGIPLYINQSGPTVPILCNPFHWDLTDRPCSPGEIRMDNATQVWSGYVCQVSSSGICVTQGRLTPELYNQMASAVDVTSALYGFTPFLADLENCTFAKEAFTEIYTSRCPQLELQSKRIYLGLLIGSLSILFSVLLWLLYSPGKQQSHGAGPPHGENKES